MWDPGILRWSNGSKAPCKSWWLKVVVDHFRDLCKYIFLMRIWLVSSLALAAIIHMTQHPINTPADIAAQVKFP